MITGIHHTQPGTLAQRGPRGGAQPLPPPDDAAGAGRGEGRRRAGCPPRVVGHPARYFFTMVAVNDPWTPVSPSPVSSITFRAMASGLLMRRPGLTASAASRSSQKWLVREHGCFGQFRMGATSGA